MSSALRTAAHLYFTSWFVLQASRYEGRHKEVMDAAGTVFADAGEEFASLKAVKVGVSL